MFKPVAMTRLRLVTREQDERVVLRHLGQGEVMQLTRLAAGADTAPLPPRDSRAELARLEQISARNENLRRALELPATGPAATAAAISLEGVEQALTRLEAEAGESIQRRLRLRDRAAELAAVETQIAGVGEFDLPLDPPDRSTFLQLVTGWVPAENVSKLDVGESALLLVLGDAGDRRRVLAFASRAGWAKLDRALQAAGFEPEPLPVAPGLTASALARQSRREAGEIAGELQALDARLQAIAARFAPVCSQVEAMVRSERRLLEAEQNFPRTESVRLIGGWVPAADVPALERRIRDLTRESGWLEVTPAEKCPAEEIPVLLRPPGWLRPFGLLVSAYGLPQYRELDPTLLVAVSYLLMFGMMFGDVGHGLVFAAGGLLMFGRCRQPQLRDVGLLVLFCGLSSMVFGALYGSWFGLPALKHWAVWHDPLEGDPLGFMSTAIGAGIVLMSCGLIFNVANHVRRGRALAGCLDKFGLAGILFYWGLLGLLLNYGWVRSQGLTAGFVGLFVILPVLGWILKEPIEVLRRRRRGQEGAGTGAETHTLAGAFMESLVEVFEGGMSYLSNTVSFVRLAAYAMSHSALLLAAFMMAGQIRHVPTAGGALSVAVVVLGNVVALVLEGIIAAVQALRLEYYEFFSKFYPGNGQPFQPFCLAGPRAGS
jgi:V/A-type H+-transporting ATPase subunit I